MGLKSRSLLLPGLLFCLLMYAGASYSQNEGLVIPLWSETPPGAPETPFPTEVTERSTDPLVPNRAVQNIYAPHMNAFFPEKPNGMAVLICPGGAYAYQAFDKEGFEIAQWLNRNGITAFVLRYRLPGEGHEPRHNIPLQDAQRAMRLIRSRAGEWNLTDSLCGVMGFSAGGHLASSLGTLYDLPVYPKKDSIDLLSARPGFMVLLYPVISMEIEYTHKGSRSNLLGLQPNENLIRQFTTNYHVDRLTPPVFIVHANDDGAVSSMNSILFYEALLESSVPASLHIFERGGHGFGLHGEGPVESWSVICEKWLDQFVVIYR